MKNALYMNASTQSGIWIIKYIVNFYSMRFISANIYIYIVIGIHWGYLYFAHDTLSILLLKSKKVGFTLHVELLAV